MSARVENRAVGVDKDFACEHCRKGAKEMKMGNVDKTDFLPAAILASKHFYNAYYHY